jgi:hypothetical protein
MPTNGASHSGDLGLPNLFYGGGSSVSSLHHASLSAQGSNTLGFAVVAPSVPPASPMLAVPLVGAGVLFVSNNTLSGLYTSMTTHLTAFTPVFPAAWIGLRPTPPPLSRGLHTNRATSRLQDKF